MGWDEIFAAVQKKQAKSTAAGSLGPGGEHLPIEWPKLTMAEMYMRPLELEWEGGAAATENLEEFVCRAQQKPRAEPTCGQQENLLKHLEDLFIPEPTYAEALPTAHQPHANSPDSTDRGGGGGAKLSEMREPPAKPRRTPSPGHSLSAVQRARRAQGQAGQQN